MAMCRRALGDQPRVQTSLVTPCENPQFLSWAICDEIGVSVQAVDDEREACVQKCQWEKRKLGVKRHVLIVEILNLLVILQLKNS